MRFIPADRPANGYADPRNEFRSKRAHRRIVERDGEPYIPRENNVLWLMERDLAMVQDDTADTEEAPEA